MSLFFAYNLGAHYTGAVMGMAYGSGSIRLWPALIVAAVLAFVGAAFLSHGVELTVGQHIVAPSRVTVGDATVVVASASALTFLYNRLRIPVSTIQILIFAVAGMGVAAGIPVAWGQAVLSLAIVWVVAPAVGLATGYVGTAVLDRITNKRDRAPRWLPALLLVMGGAAALTMGANDVSNASGVLVMTGLMTPLQAGALAGLFMAIGILTWGRGLLERVAFDIVRVDLKMATAAQFAQAAVVLAAVSGGLFTSMNQALVGGVSGAGLRRGPGHVEWQTLRAILRGWVIAPASGFALGFVLTGLLTALV